MALTISRVAVVREAGDEVGVRTNLEAKLLSDMIEECGEEMNVLREDRGVLHAEETRTTELTVFDIQMKFSTTTVDGRPVRVRAVIPLTLKAPR